MAGLVMPWILSLPIESTRPSTVRQLMSRHGFSSACGLTGEPCGGESAWGPCHAARARGRPPRRTHSTAWKPTKEQVSWKARTLELAKAWYYTADAEKLLVVLLLLFWEKLLGR